MEQLLGEFETINSATNAKLDSIKEQYSQYDTGIVDTGSTSGLAAPKDAEQMDATGEISKKFYTTRWTHGKSHGKINNET